MIGPILALLLGGAQNSAPDREAWTPANIHLTPAVVLTVAPEPETAALPAAPERPEPLFPPRLEKAVVRPAL